MFNNWNNISRKSFGFMRYSNHKNPFKYLLAPIKAGVDESKLPPRTKIDQKTIEYLESVSLVGFENEKAVKILEDAIRFADQIIEVNTDGLEPMISVLEDECLRVRQDTAESEVTRNDLLSYTTKCVEHYYVTPGADSLRAESKQEFSQAQKIKKSVS